MDDPLLLVTLGVVCLGGCGLCFRLALEGYRDQQALSEKLRRRLFG